MLFRSALLKVLEEPPKYAMFILTVTNKSALLETVLSRSVVLTLEGVNEVLGAKYICSKDENADYDEALKACTVWGGNIGKAIESLGDSKLSKISGCCGRLMCCLKYEQNSYEYLEKITPRVGSTVEWGRNNRGKVVEVALLTGKLKVLPDDAVEGSAPITVSRDEVKIVKNK